MKKLTVNLDAVIVVALVLVASLGMNVWQILNTRELTRQYVDAQWKLGNTEADAVYARSLLEHCEPGTIEGTDPRP